MSKKVVIIGKGVWGQALHLVLSQNKSVVTFWDRISPITDADILVLALPVKAMREALSQAKVSCKTIVNTSKGIEQNTTYFPRQIVEEVLGDGVDYYALMGPSFAAELTLKMPTLINLGYQRGHAREEVKQLFQTDYFRVHLTSSIDALEFAGAFKNIYAIICGVVDGIGFGENTRVELITLALEEMQKYFQAQDIKFSHDALIGTTGDLVLTCNSMESRNFRFGKLITQHSVKDALEKIAATVEGYNSAMSVKEIIAKYQTPLPLAEFIFQILKEDNPETIRERVEQYLRQI